VVLYGVKYSEAEKAAANARCIAHVRPAATRLAATDIILPRLL
jgi:hypothetical protein